MNEKEQRRNVERLAENAAQYLVTAAWFGRETLQQDGSLSVTCCDVVFVDRNQPARLARCVGLVADNASLSKRRCDVFLPSAHHRRRRRRRRHKYYFTTAACAIDMRIVCGVVCVCVCVCV